MMTHLVFDGVADGPLGVALDVMSTSARLLRSGLVTVPMTERAVRQRVVSVDGKPVRTGAGRLLPVDGALSVRGLHEGDVVAIPGLGAATEAQVASLLERPDILRGIVLLGRMAPKRVVLAASCSATFVLAASGALAGKQATTTWWLGAAFARRFTHVKLRADKMVIDAGGVLTAGSAFAHADLMLAIVARTLSPSLAHMVARYLVLDERVSQARYMVTEHLRSADPTVRELEAFVLANIERQVSVHEMARATATSPRTLARRVEEALGTTPHQLAQRLRVARAIHLLDTTSDSVESIAARVGYADAAAFRRVFRRETGGAPRTSRTSGLRQAARGGPEVLRYEDVEVGDPGPGEVRIRHVAVGLNYADTYLRNGTYPVPLPSGMGVEASGVVVAVGAGVTNVALGDRVTYTGFMDTLGAYSTERLIPAAPLIKLPDTIAFETAAAMTMRGLTSSYLMRRIYDFKPGDSILLHAAAGGVGLIVSQWAKILGLNVIGTVSTEAKAEVARAHGCDHIINYSHEDIAPRVRELTDGVGVNVVFDSVGKDTFMSSLDSLKRRGLLVCVGTASGPIEPFNPQILAWKGSLCVTRPALADYIADPAEKAELVGELFDHVGSGRIKIEINQHYALEDAVQAHRDLEARKTIGSSIFVI